jgi:hypothetical protein
VRLAVIIAVLLAGCHATPPPQGPAPYACLEPIRVHFGSCGQRMAGDVACAVCEGARGCYAHGVYCVGDLACDDPTCRP